MSGAVRAVPRGGGLGLRIALVLVVALLAGGLTPLGQQYLPDAIRSAANSAGGWEIVLVLAVWTARLPPLPAAITGLVAFVLMLEAYSAVSSWRGFPDRSLFGFWGIVALVAGPLIGLATAWLRARSRVLAAIGVVIVSAPLLGEAVYGLTAIRATPSPVWWSIEAVLGIALAGVVAFAGARRPGRG